MSVHSFMTRESKLGIHSLDDFRSNASSYDDFSSSTGVEEDEGVVQFTEVQVRYYERILGDHPSCSAGAPIAIGWRHTPEMQFTVNDYEARKFSSPSAKRASMMDKETREDLLKFWGVERRDIAAAVRRTIQSKRQRRRTINSSDSGYDRWEAAIEKMSRGIKKRLKPVRLHSRPPPPASKAKQPPLSPARPNPSVLRKQPIVSTVGEHSDSSSSTSVLLMNLPYENAPARPTRSLSPTKITLSNALGIPATSPRSPVRRTLPKSLGIPAKSSRTLRLENAPSMPKRVLSPCKQTRKPAFRLRSSSLSSSAVKDKLQAPLDLSLSTMDPTANSSFSSNLNSFSSVPREVLPEKPPNDSLLLNSASKLLVEPPPSPSSDEGGTLSPPQPEEEKKVAILFDTKSLQETFLQPRQRRRDSTLSSFCSVSSSLSSLLDKLDDRSSNSRRSDRRLCLHASGSNRSLLNNVQ